MSQTPPYDSAADWYAAILKNCRKSKLPPNYPQPQPPAAWPEENVALLEEYLRWLYADNAALTSIRSFYLPIAGHLLGYHLQPHSKLKLKVAEQRVLDYLEAKQVSERWLKMARLSLGRFGRFLHQQRGYAQLPNTLQNLESRLKRYQDELPDWLVEQLCHYQQLRQANWRESRLKGAIINFWRSHTQLWRWLFTNTNVTQISDIKRQHLLAFIDAELEAGYSVATINLELRAFQATLRFLQTREFEVPQVLLRQAGLREPADLPRFLTDAQVARLQAAIEQRVKTVNTPARKRNALLDRAIFYLLWQAGLRGSELADMVMKDVDLTNQQLVVRGGKGLKDRTVYLTEAICTALKAYLSQRGSGLTDHLFLYRHKPLSREMVRNRMKAAGKKAAVTVTPHQLRHTFATQLVNVGCPITTIQSLMGHKRLSTTLVYAQVHNQTVADDYFTAMQQVEQRLEQQLTKPEEEVNKPNTKTTAAKLLTLANTLQNESLPREHQVIVAALQQGLAELASVMREPETRTEQVVNEPVTYPT